MKPNNEAADYTVIRSGRKTLSLELRDGGRLLVRAPFRVSDAAVADFVRSHADWIARHRAAAQERAAQQPNAEPLSEAELAALTEAAKRYFTEAVQHFAPLVGKSPKKLTIRCQKTRWGSCSAAGNLNFNCLLMLAPERVRDYIAVHELCHLWEMNHSPRFWAQVSRVFPDYAAQRRWLRQNGSVLMSRAYDCR